MSANQNVDGVCDFFTALASKLIANFGPAALSFLVWVLETWKVVLRQVQRTARAMIGSFYSEYIVFYEENGVYYPTIKKDYGDDTFMTGRVAWQYTISTNTFIKVNGNTENYSEHLIDFIGATLSRNGEHLGDLSDWILDQTILSDSAEIPLQVMVGAWAYYNRVPLYYNYPGYTFTIMTMDGDEKVYNLRTGQEQVSEPRLPASPSEEASGEESESSLEEGEIPMPRHESDSKED